MHTQLPCCVCGSKVEARKGFLPIDAMEKAKAGKPVFVFNICRQCIAKMLIDDVGYQVLSVKQLKRIMR